MELRYDLRVTVLDLPEILELLHEAIDAVPEWERQQLLDRLKAIIVRARAAQRVRRR